LLLPIVPENYTCEELIMLEKNDVMNTVTFAISLKLIRDPPGHDQSILKGIVWSLYGYCCAAG